MQNKNTIAEVLLSIFIPFYIFYWLSEASKSFRLRGAVHTPSIKPVVWLSAILTVSFLIFFIPFFLLPFIAPLLMTESGSDTVVVGSFLLFFASFGLAFLQFAIFVALYILYVVYAINFSKAGAYAVPGLDKTTVTLLLIFFAPAAVYIVQEKLNGTYAPVMTPQQINQSAVAPVQQNQATINNS